MSPNAMSCSALQVKYLAPVNGPCMPVLKFSLVESKLHSSRAIELVMPSWGPRY